MKKMQATIIAASLALAAQAGVYNIKPDTSDDRVESPLSVGMARIGTIRPRAAQAPR